MADMNQFPQIRPFSNGGAVGHKLLDGAVSAWWDINGNLTDCCRRDGRGAIRKPNRATVEYLRKHGPAMVRLAHRQNITDARGDKALPRVAVFKGLEQVAEVNGMLAAMAVGDLYTSLDQVFFAIV